MNKICQLTVCVCLCACTMLVHLCVRVCVCIRVNSTHKITLFKISDCLGVLLLLEALKLQRSFGLLNEFLPFGPVSDAFLPVCYFHVCYVALYIVFPV